ncbi:MAG: phosphohydrolase, partial [Desulfobacterales bacterium]|nr:phosphohydrolase [Desulfobacterales bacterium]
QGEEIPIAARIFAIVDVWDALRSDRPYRKAWTDEAAMNEIKRGKGSHFDPVVWQTFFDVINLDKRNKRTK